MFKFVTLAFIGAVSCFNTEESTMLKDAKKATTKSAGSTLEAHNEAKK